MRSVTFGPKPRRGDFADSPGAYEQAFRIVNPVIDPGDMLIVEQYFTGYGEISAAKVAFYPSDDVFVHADSIVLCGLKRKDGAFIFGGQEVRVDPVGNVIMLAGLQAEGWGKSTLFFDLAHDPLPQILTETKQIEPPLSYKLRTRMSTRPGTYALEFCFVYFNGTAWKSSGRKIEFKVRNFLERHQVAIGTLALLAAVAALGRFVVLPVFRLILERWQ